MLWMLPAVVAYAGPLVADATEQDYEVFALATQIGQVRANTEICGILRTSDSNEALDVISTAAFVARARYSQLGLTAEDESEDEHKGEVEARRRHKDNPAQLHCEIFRRQLYGLIILTAHQGADFIGRVQKLTKP